MIHHRQYTLTTFTNHAHILEAGSIQNTWSCTHQAAVHNEIMSLAHYAQPARAKICRVVEIGASVSCAEVLLPQSSCPSCRMHQYGLQLGLKAVYKLSQYDLRARTCARTPTISLMIASILVIASFRRERAWALLGKDRSLTGIGDTRLGCSASLCQQALSYLRRTFSMFGINLGQPWSIPGCFSSSIGIVVLGAVFASILIRLRWSERALHVLTHNRCLDELIQQYWQDRARGTERRKTCRRVCSEDTRDF